MKLSPSPAKGSNPQLKGRGVDSNTSGRFERHQIEPDLTDLSWSEEELTPLKTEFLVDHSKTILAENNSEDIPFRYSINPYRGCEHGCAYCYARPTHEYLGFSAGLDFETKIFVKHNAPELLRTRLMDPHWRPQVIAMSGVTDCYQPAERKFELTRECLKVLSEFKNPVSLITKNQLITRDIDILSEMARQNLVSTCLSVTTLDAQLARALEPRTSTPQARLRAIEKLAEAQIPVAVNVAPVIPGLTDHEMPTILKAAANAGATSAGYTPLRLPFSVKDLFLAWLDRYVPEKKQKVIEAIFDIRDGKLNRAQFGERMTGFGKRADTLRQMFRIFSQKYGLNQKSPKLATDLFQCPGQQLKLF